LLSVPVEKPLVAEMRSALLLLNMAQIVCPYECPIRHGRQDAAKGLLSEKTLAFLKKVDYRKLPCGSKINFFVLLPVKGS